MHRTIEKSLTQRLLHQKVDIVEKLVQLSAYYLRLILALLVSSVRVETTSMLTLKNDFDGVEFGHLEIDKLLDVCRRNFSSSKSGNQNRRDGEWDSELSLYHLIECITDGLLEHLRLCRDARISNQLLEILSILSLCLNSGTLHSKLIAIHWSALHTEYDNQEATVIPSPTPHVFLDTVRRSMQSSDVAGRKSTPKGRALAATILKTSKMNSADSPNSQILVVGMIRHWGLMLVSPDADYYRLNTHLDHLLNHLETLLDKIHKEFPNARRKHNRDDISDEDYIPPKGRRNVGASQDISSLPGLDRSTFPVYYEALLHLIVASVSVSASAYVGGNGGFDGPFSHLESFAEIFGSMIGLFVDKINIFPRRVTSIVFNASKSMVNISMYQLQQCVEWRHSQPMPSVDEEEASVKDIASTQHLHDLMISLWVHVVDRLQSLCDSVEIGDDDDDDAELKSRGSGDQQKASSLRSAVDKAKQVMETIARSHRVELSKKYIRSQKGKKRHSFRQKTVAVQDLHSFMQDKFVRNDRQHNGNAMWSRERRHQEVSNAEAEDSSCSSALDNDDESETSESFEVCGNWGPQALEDKGLQDRASLKHPTMLRQV